MATSDTSCSARASAAAATADRSTNRTRFLRSVDRRHQRRGAANSVIAVRLSAFDTVPFAKDESGTGVGRTRAATADRWAFGLLDRRHFDAALEDARGLLALLEELGVRWICVTGGSPYYNPHVQRPALFPPSDGYEPPEDPMHRRRAADRGDGDGSRRRFLDSYSLDRAYSYLQDWLPHVAQYTVRQGMTDIVGLGRMVLAYPELPADVLAGRPLQRKTICRTFSDCTTGPRLGLVSGCYPLDPLYLHHPDGLKLKEMKKTL